MPGCVPGDLAIIVASRNEKNIGRFVRVLRAPVMSDGLWVAPLQGEKAWLIEALGGSPLVVGEYDFSSGLWLPELRRVSQAVIADNHLDPIRPPAKAERAQTAKTQPKETKT